MLLAHARATIADVGAGPTEQFGGWRSTTHPSSRQGAKISAILAEANADFLKFRLIAFFHADHVAGAPVAYLCTGHTGLDAMSQVFSRQLMTVMHQCSFR